MTGEASALAGGHLPQVEAAVAPPQVTSSAQEGADAGVLSTPGGTALVWPAGLTSSLDVVSEEAGEVASGGVQVTMPQRAKGKGVSRMPTLARLAGVSPTSEASSSARAVDEATSEMAADAAIRAQLEGVRVLIVFAGERWHDDLTAQLLRAGAVAVTPIDIDIGGRDHDVLDNDVLARLITEVAAGAFDFVFVAPPCESFSVALGHRLRSRAEPDGVASPPRRWAAYLRKHNRLAAAAARVLRAADAAGVGWAAENPADRGGVKGTSPAWWGRFSRHAPLWLSSPFSGLATDMGAPLRTFAQCHPEMGGVFQKWTSILHARDASPELAVLDTFGCPHQSQRHSDQAYGKDALGRARAKLAARYPRGMNAFLANAIMAYARRRRAEKVVAAEGETAARRSDGGRVATGAIFHAEVEARIETARHSPPKFASLRNRLGRSRARLRFEPLPQPLLTPTPAERALQFESSQQSADAAEMACGECLRELEAMGEGSEPSVSRECAEACARLAMARERARRRRLEAGPIAIAELYLDGVYESQILSWLQLAKAAAEAMQRGEHPQRPPTRVIGQGEMQEWARGTVWDCTDPARCVPVARSTANTVFPGRRQLDRAALLAAAIDLGWHDQDILGQVCGGGIETRSSCPLDTVLSFHHQGLFGQVGAAAKVIAADLQEEWVAPPVPHLPFVPCRVLPRNVVMQEKHRLVDVKAGGEPRLESYLKPRVTQDSSDGPDGIAVNEGVSDAERFVLLPTIQRFGRGVAICDTAGGGNGEEPGEVRAGAYVVDAESAFRFCPLQHLDLWTQCFIWWGPDGSVGICVDRRMAFGGAYSPNRFERLSTLVAAIIARLQEQFDAVNPFPAVAQAWGAARRAAAPSVTELGERGQDQPRYCQVFIDDFKGATLDDQVIPPPEVRGVELDPTAGVVIGCEAASVTSRVHVHAQLAVLGLRSVGLSAAPAKVVAGDPVVGLGMRVGVRRWRIDVPELKRVALLADIAEQRAAAVGFLRADRERVERLVGRLVNISQVLPELTMELHGGYALLEARWRVRGRMCKPRLLRLKEGGRALGAWLSLLDLAHDLISVNEGVDLAPELVFPGRADPNVLTVVSDASGIDGVGGYGFWADAPKEAWLVSEPWPTTVKAALRCSARGDKGKGQPAVSTPAVELFGMRAVADAVARASERVPSAVIAVGDCEPAVNVFNAGASGHPQMRRLARVGELNPRLGLGVQVPRELNRDADRLSHPELLAEVTAEATAAGVTPRRAPIAQAAWTALEGVLLLGGEPTAASRKRRR